MKVLILSDHTRIELEDADTGRRWRQTAAELMKRGLGITIDEVPGSSLIFYEANVESDPKVKQRIPDDSFNY